MRAADLHLSSDQEIRLASMFSTVRRDKQDENSASIKVRIAVGL